jgi:hypothetical protein
MSRRLLVTLVTTAALSGALAPAAGAADQPGAKATQVTSKVLVKKFVVRKTGLTALGNAVTDVGGSTTRQVVALKAATGSNCQVLTLQLDRLNLALLGLNLDVSAVNLRITGDRSRTLGALFCRLATATRLGKVASARAAAATLNRRLAARPMQVVGFRAAIRPQTAPAGGDPQPASPGATAAQAPPAPVCNVLDLTLGPLNLDLLGLVVDLYGKTRTDPVQVHVTANPGGGVIGRTFCQLAS